jgi:signal peptidase I
MTALMILVVFGFWYGTQFALNTQYPALAVASTSMLPTLNVGDVIIVQGVPASQINANYSTGDIVVYRHPWDLDKLIVHRAVKKEFRNGSYWLTTKGDNNSVEDAAFIETYLIGKVVGRVPNIGNFALFINALGNFYYFIIIIIIVVNILLSLVLDTDEKKKSEEAPRKERKLFGKLSIGMLLFLILNVFLISCIVFSLFGSFTFWQIGSDPPQNVTIRGMYADLQYHQNYRNPPHNVINETYLSQGLFTYKIDTLVNGAIRSGAPTFSWAQFTVLLLVVLDLWILFRYFHLGRRLGIGAKTQS